LYLSQAIKRSEQTNANGVATIFGDRRYTWTQSHARIALLAGALRSLGVAANDGVAIMAMNSDRYYEFFYAVVWAGGVFVPINTRLALPEVDFWLSDSGSKILFVDDQYLPFWRKLAGRFPDLTHCRYLGDGDLPDGLLSYEKLITEADAIADTERGYEDLAGLFYTGGTTGRSKGVMLSHRNIGMNAFNVIPALGFKRDMRWLHAAPMFHIADGAATFGVSM
jgi:long-chain acyl-CoA synthetase